MTGRGHRGRGGQGGRGRGKFKGRGNTEAPRRKKTIDDYFYYVGLAKQASDYNLTTEQIILHIKKEYERRNDVSEALRMETMPNVNMWEPTLQQSQSTKDEERDFENEQFRMKYKAKLDKAMRRKRVSEDNVYKAYALIWDRCAKAMQARIVAQSDYEGVIYNNLISLLKAIREHTMNFQEVRYKMLIISDAFQAFLGTKQLEGESLNEYTRRFKSSRDMLISHLGAPINLSKYVKTMEGYDGSNLDKILKLMNRAQEQLFAFTFFENSNQNKYSSIMTNLNSQKSLKNDQYPKTIVDACKVLSLHKFDNHGKSKKQENWGQSKRPK